MITRRDFIKTGPGFCGVLLAMSAFPGAARAELAGRKPNIIVILTDDQGYGDAGCTGNPILKTPNLDRLHNEGIRFTDFHVSPSCAPTRASLLSGKHEFKNGVTHTILERERLSLKTTTIAQVLKEAGYTTGIFGKWHLGDEDPYQPEKRGFDEVFIHGGGGIGQSYPGSCGDAPGNKYFNPAIKHNGKFEKTTGFCTDIFTTQALKWIDEQKAGRPFFCYIPYNAAHAPLSCPPEFKQPYLDKVPDETATFFGMVANIDANVGRILAKLDEKGIARETLVIFMNDNGGQGPACKIYNAGMRGGKCTAFNGGTRAMSFWRWPGTLKPGDRPQLAAHIDLFPTFAELAGARIPAAVAADQDGFSLAPLLAETPPAAWHDDRMLFTHVGRWGGMKPGAEPDKYGGPGNCSIRWQQYLQVRIKGGWSLFDLKADPGEKNDIAAGHADIVAKLDQAYNAWWNTVLPCLDNESAWKTKPAKNPFKEQYWRQFNGPGPNNVPPGTVINE